MKAKIFIICLVAFIAPFLSSSLNLNASQAPAETAEANAIYLLETSCGTHHYVRLSDIKVAIAYLDYVDFIDCRSSIR